MECNTTHSILMAFHHRKRRFTLDLISVLTKRRYGKRNLTSRLTTNSRNLLHHHLRGSRGWDSEIMLLVGAKRRLRHDHYVPVMSVLVYRREYSIILQYQTNCLSPVYHCWVQIVPVIWGVHRQFVSQDWQFSD